MPSRFGPHVQHPTPAALAWARRASIVKALDDPTPLAAAHPDALLIFRAVMNDWGTQFTQPIGFFQTTMARLDSFRAKGRLYVELLNEVPPEQTAQYISFAKQVVPLFHAAGLLVIGPNFATGDYNLDDWAEWRRADWAGLDLIGVHAYWATKGPTPWNGYRWRTYYDPTLDGRELVVTECGRDRVRDGDGGTYIGKGGWKADGLAGEQYAGELNAYARSLLAHESAVAFGAGADAHWANYEIDSIAPLIVATPATPTKPPEKKMADFDSPNHDGLRSQTLGLVLHATLSTKAITLQEEYESTINYFQNPAPEGDRRKAVSAHLIIGPGRRRHWSVDRRYIAWHCLTHNGTHVGIEAVKTQVHDALEDDVFDELAKATAELCIEYKLQIRWAQVDGFEEHRNMSGNNHQDIGGPFDRDLFLARVKHYAALTQGDDALTNEQKKAVLDDLDILWGMTKADTIKANPAESERACHERIVAVKTTLGLNG